MKELDKRIENGMQTIKDFALKELERCNQYIEKYQHELDVMKNYVKLYETTIHYIDLKMNGNAASDELPKDE